MTVLNRLPMSKRLKAVLAEESGMPCELRTIPKVEVPGPGPKTLKPVDPPYFILHPLWTGTSGPPLSSPDADSEWTYQATAYARKPDQLEWMRDLMFRVFLGRAGGAFVVPIEVPGMRVMDRIFKDDNAPDPDDVSGLFWHDLRVGIKVTPADT